MTAWADLSCRTADLGGDFNADVAWLGVPPLRGLSHLIVLIHGFNDPVDEARVAYQAFDRLQSAMVSPGLDWAFGATVVRYFWPGDANWGLLRPAFYAKALGRADDAGSLLADIVKDLSAHAPGVLTLDLVAHSMGNRAALRAMGLLQGVAGVHLRKVVHMAAAVPVGRLEQPKDELAQGLAMETAEGEATSLYSGDDKVLAYAFPVGETEDASEEGHWPVALGHRDWLQGHSVPRFNQSDASPAGHGDYWPGPAAQAQVRQALDLAVAGSRVLPERATPVASEPLTRELDTRTTATRQVALA